MAAPRVVESTNYPYLQVHFAVHGYDETVWAYVDTGFDGYLAIPQARASRLPPADRMGELTLADDETISAQVRYGTLDLPGLTDPSDAWIVALGNEYILGRAVIDRFRLTFDRGTRLIAEA